MSFERDVEGRVVSEVFTVQGDQETFVQAELLRVGLASTLPQAEQDCLNGAAMVEAERLDQEQP